MGRKERMRETINRREFLAAGAAAAAALAAESVPAAGGDKFHALPESTLPGRPFGSTGAVVPVLTFGAAGSWLNYDEDTALKILSDAIDKGVTSIDTAAAYGKGKSEQLIGALGPERRKDILIHDKLYTRDKDKWWAQLEASLKRLKTDYVDTLMIHAWGHGEEKGLEAKGGPLEQLYRAKEQKLCRWIGVSCHSNSAGLLEFIKRHRLDSIMISLNVATEGYTDDSGHLDLGFAEKVLPEAVRQGQGIIAMKVFGAGRIAGKYPAFDHATCLRYVLSLPVAGATITMPNFQQVRDNIQAAKNFKPFTPEEMKKLNEKARGEIKSSFSDFMRQHSDLT